MSRLTNFTRSWGGGRRSLKIRLYLAVISPIVSVTIVPARFRELITLKLLYKSDIIGSRAVRDRVSINEKHRVRHSPRVTEKQSVVFSEIFPTSVSSRPRTVLSYSELTGTSPVLIPVHVTPSSRNPYECIVAIPLPFLARNAQRNYAARDNADIKSSVIDLFTSRGTPRDREQNRGENDEGRERQIVISALSQGQCFQQTR